MSYAKLKERVKGRTVGVISHGTSVYELEDNIESLKDYDICWASFNLYSIIERFILSKIDKKLEIILEAADSDNKTYELAYRIPSMKQVIDRGDLAISTWKLMRTEFEKKGLKSFYEENEDKIILADDILEIIDVPNTLSILLYCIAVCQPKRIILFGVDGYQGKSNEDEYITYYHPELAKERRSRQLKHREHFSLIETSSDFENDFNAGLQRYCNKYMVVPPDIINCSPGSLFSCIRKIDYANLLPLLENVS